MAYFAHLKFKHPEITSAFLLQDKAGCCHNSVLLATCNTMRSNTRIRVCQVNLNDPQGRKGACDRKAGKMKAHVRCHINKGHNVQNAKDFRDAVLEF